MAPRPRELGALDRGDRPGAGGVRDADALAPRARRRRRERVRPHLARRDRDPRRLEGPRARAGVHVAAVPVPGAGRARRHASTSCRWTSSRRRSTRAPTSSRSPPCSPRRASSPTWTRSPTRRTHHGARTIIDATHAIGWLPLDATRFDAVACAAYKWLMSPRGTAFMVLEPELADTLNPDQAGWYAAANPLTDQFGPPLRLARRPRAGSTPRPRGSAGSGTEPALQRHQRDRRRGHPRARPRAREPLPGRPRRAGGQLRDRHLSRPGRHGEARASGDHGRRPRGPSPRVISPLQHRSRRRRGA